MARLVDGPGYGFARVSKRSENKFKKLLKVYMTESSRLCKIFWCLNPEHGFAENDRVVFNFIKNLNLPIQLVFTKADRMHKLKLFEKIKAMTHVFKSYDDIVSPFVNITSSETGFGITELRASVKHAILEAPTRTIYKKAGKITYFPEDHFTELEKETFRVLIQDDHRYAYKELEKESKKLLR